MHKPSRVEVAGPLAVYAIGFRRELAGGGYSRSRTTGLLLLMARLSRWLAEHGRDAGELFLGATVDGRPVVAGGFNFDVPGRLDSVEIRLAAGAWHFAAPMPIGLANATAAVLGGQVWVIGGFDHGDFPVDVVEIYDPQADRWSAGPPLPVGLAAAGVAVLDDVLYVAGGFDNDGEPTAMALAYDPHGRRWPAIAALPSARARLRLAAAGGHLYAIGGQNADGDTVRLTDRYDPRTGTWHRVAPMHEDRTLPGVTVLGTGRSSRIAVVGGCRLAGGSLLGFRRTTEVYSPISGRWRLLPSLLPTGRCSLSTAAGADGHLLAIGGGADTAPGGQPTAVVNALGVGAFQ